MSQAELESEDSGRCPAERPAERYVVRYGLMRLVAEFAVRGPQKFSRTTPVIVRSSRGLEWGEVLCQATDRTTEYLESQESIGKILRQANDDDARQRDEVYQQERVDFRDLVKALAKRYKTRIEMRQIGVRDEAKLLADYGDCGKPVCCNTHLSRMPPVSMRMAKVQKSTLDPSRISGRCGRLKCCLRFEQNVYDEFQKQLPPPGTRGLTQKGQGRGLAQEIVARKVLVEFEDGRRVVVAASEILTRLGS